MKLNAIIRIIIWSVTLVVLLGVLCTFTFGSPVINKLMRTESVPEETAIPVRIEENPNDPSPAAFATAIENINVHSAPNPEGNNVTSMVPAGETVSITRYEDVAGIKWAYITAPSAGWVQAQYLSASQEDTTSVGRLHQVIYAPDEISELDIEWVAGTIRVQGADVDDIQISESEVSDIKYAMYLKKNGSKLSIDFSEDDDLFDFGISITETISKDLTILVPYSWECDSLDIDAAAADLEVTGLVIDEVDIDSASGKCTFENCVVDEMDVDTASGDILFRGELNVLECDAASSLVDLFPENVPSRISVESLSGNLGLTLPASAGFTLDMDSMSGDFITEFGFAEKKDGTYTSGDGACSIRFNSMSGMVVINKSQPEAAAIADTPATSDASSTHHHTDSCITDPASCPVHSETHHTEPHHE